LELLDVALEPPVGQQARVHLGVQGLDPAVQALWEAGELLHPHHRHPGLRDLRGGGAGGHDLHARGVQTLGELLEPGLVVDADQCWLDGDATHLPILTFRSSRVHPSRARRPTTSTNSGFSTALMRSWREASSSSSRTGTTACAMIGPVSTPSSTKWTVQP